MQDQSHGQTEQDTKKEAEELEEFKQRYYYLAAEMENMKKRMEREKENYLKFSTEKVLGDLIEVVDNFERVTMSLSFDQDPKVKNIVFGIDMVAKIFFETLKKHGLEPISCVGQIFDPYKHEAVGQEPAPGKKDQEIIKELQKGYTLNGRVLRAAKVIVVAN